MCQSGLAQGWQDTGPDRRGYWVQVQVNYNSSEFHGVDTSSGSVMCSPFLRKGQK